MNAISKPAQHVELDEETVRRAEKEERDYLDFLDYKDFLAQQHYEEEQMIVFRRERRDDTAIEWHEAFEDKLQEMAQLKSFALEVYAGRTQPPFDMEDLLERWSMLAPSVRSALTWLAGRCSGYRQRDESPRHDVHYHQVRQEAPSSANLGS